MKVKPARALTQRSYMCMNLQLATGRNEGKARQGIDTNQTTGSSLASVLVEMKVKPARALTHRNTFIGELIIASRNEDKACQGIDTRGQSDVN